MGSDLAARLTIEAARLRDIAEGYHSGYYAAGMTGIGYHVARALRDAAETVEAHSVPFAGYKWQRDRAVELLRRLVQADDQCGYSSELGANAFVIAEDARTFLASLDAAPSEEG